MIRRSTMHELMTSAEWPALLAEYVAEAHIDGMPAVNAKLENYNRLEWTGCLQVHVAEKDGSIIGFVIILAPILPHYDIPIAVVESYFVAAAHRSGGAGLRLLATAEEAARTLKSPGVLLSAPLGGRLAEILPRRGYKETSRVFFKAITHD